MESMKSGLNKVIENVMPSKIREEQYDRMERRVENQEQRIGALEVTVRDHMGQHERAGHTGFLRMFASLNLSQIKHDQVFKSVA